MRVLLDTHVWLWMLGAPRRIAQRSRELLDSADNELVLSAASTWEIAIKYASGRLPFPGDPEALVPTMMAETRVAPLEVSHAHSLRVARLPLHHRDPFDRLLIAQAQIERVPIMTADPHFGAYDVEVIAA